MIRTWELESIRDYFPSGALILEVGAGRGLQARMLSDWGHTVVAVELPDTAAQSDLFDVLPYERVLPFRSGAFEIVYTSNVLEHVTDIPGFLNELCRVAKPDARHVHFMPSSSWRVSTSITHYIYVMRIMFKTIPRLGSLILRVGSRSLGNGGAIESGSSGPSRSVWRRKLRSAAFASRHGEFPNAAAEVWYYRKNHWVGVFERHGFRVVEAKPSGIFSTGYGALPGLALNTRRILSRWFGSSSNVFTLVR